MEDVNMLLSILVPTIPSRINGFFLRLVNQLQEQINASGRVDVEVLGLFDNKKRSTGDKRNDLLNLARGKYLVFIDDDDRIAGDYVSSICEALDKNPTADCVVFDCICNIATTGQNRYCRYGVELDYWESPDGEKWTGKPAHTMVYSHDIAIKYLYKGINVGEDIDWVVRACKEIKNQIRINKVLYYYDYNPTTSERNG